MSHCNPHRLGPPTRRNKNAGRTARVPPLSRSKRPGRLRAEGLTSAMGPGMVCKRRPAEAQAWPFDDAAFDFVGSQLGVMFSPNRKTGYSEAKRVLKPGGRYLFNVWDRIEENVFARDVTAALAEVFPSAPPRFLARTPHGYHDTAVIRSELDKAGFRDVVIETRAELSPAP